MPVDSNIRHLFGLLSENSSSVGMTWWVSGGLPASLATWARQRSPHVTERTGTDSGTAELRAI